MTVSKKSIKSDLNRLDNLADDEIDYTEIPEFDSKFLRSVEMQISPGKKPVALRLDTDVLDWMKAQGKGYQSRINAILRAYYEAHKNDTLTPEGKWRRERDSNPR